MERSKAALALSVVSVVCAIAQVALSFRGANVGQAPKILSVSSLSIAILSSILYYFYSSLSPVLLCAFLSSSVLVVSCYFLIKESGKDQTWARVSGFVVCGCGALCMLLCFMFLAGSRNPIKRGVVMGMRAVVGNEAAASVEKTVGRGMTLEEQDDLVTKKLRAMAWMAKLNLLPALRREYQTWFGEGRFARFWSEWEERKEDILSKETPEKAKEIDEYMKRLDPDRKIDA
jgi:hypothetical protein